MEQPRPWRYALRGPEVFMLDLGGLWKYLELGRDGVLPEDPLKPGRFVRTLILSRHGGARGATVYSPMEEQ